METPSTFEKRVKRRILGRPQRALLRFPHGLGEVCLHETRVCLDSPVFPASFSPVLSLKENAVHIEGIGYRELLALALRVTTARDLLWILDEGRADSVSQLKSKLTRIPWDFLTTPDEKWAIKATSRGSQVFHEGILKDLAQKELASRGCHAVSVKEATQRLDLRLEHNRLQVAVSIPGRFLYQRRYKSSRVSLAPIKEDLAAGIIHLAIADFPWTLPQKENSLHVWVPFAGSGTLAFESALHLRNITPEIFFGRLGAESFPCTPQASVRFARKELRARWLAHAGPAVQWHLIEKDARQVTGLQKNTNDFNAIITAATGAPLTFSVTHGDVFATPLPDTQRGDTLLALLNPPYGQRLGKGSSPIKQYGKIGQKLSEMPLDRAVCGTILAPDAPSLQSFRRALEDFETKDHVVRHGGQKITALTFCRAAQGTKA